MTTTPDLGHVYDHIDSDDNGMPPGMSNAGFVNAARAGRYPAMPQAILDVVTMRDELAAYQRERVVPTATLTPKHLAQVLFDQRQAGNDMATAVRAAVDEAAQREQSRQRTQITSQLIQNTLSNFDAYIGGRIAENLDEILAGLRAPVMATVDLLRAAYDELGDLDIHQPDPLDVAGASTAKRKAFATVAEQTKTYRHLRYLQREALSASSAPIPGDGLHSIQTWREVFATGIHEVQRPANLKFPGQGAAPRHAVRAVVERDDVWVPGIQEMSEAFYEMRKPLLNELNVHDEALRLGRVGAVGR